MDMQWEDGGVDIVQGWVGAELAAGHNRTYDQAAAVRMYFIAFHAVNPKMYDMSEAVSGEFTTLMLVVAAGGGSRR